LTTGEINEMDRVKEKGSSAAHHFGISLVCSAILLELEFYRLQSP
jgi:hypothetical protein